jgi:hypothetical protein
VIAFEDDYPDPLIVPYFDIATNIGRQFGFDPWHGNGQRIFEIIWHELGHSALNLGHICSNTPQSLMTSMKADVKGGVQACLEKFPTGIPLGSYDEEYNYEGFKEKAERMMKMTDDVFVHWCGFATDNSNEGGASDLSGKVNSRILIP